MRLPVRRVQHVQQAFNWDCGLACTEMVLRALGVSKADCSLEKLQKFVPSTSVWTIDLAYALAGFGIKFRFLTTTLGVDPTYESEPFYRTTLDSDMLRVNKLFAEAGRRNLSIERRSITSEALKELMRPNDHLVMALVDKSQLYRAPPVSFSGMVESCIAHCCTGYVGHYVLITGYNTDQKGYYVMDPAKTPEPLFVSCEALDVARKTHGTDEDLLLIPWDQQPKQIATSNIPRASAAA
ncbi:hypothetical protein AB1Y20_015563 [Prymnesium parvum]|uniref:Guanylyl cyclase n=1 Tax=Prymnesium parvum TaxID=97485 RepID=A0AB34K0X1_PRYPA|mmetsp:Transcript_43754/g.106221  ORF Transcript_43754/g.106221 Transcript_43754/m.106221 type:complete len:239 (-) Transcript_43754:153-869(-)